MYRADDTVRRTDLLLRCSYPELETEIYKTGPHGYVIRCVGYEGDFEALSKKFVREIRQAGSPVVLSQTIPDEYREKLTPIPFGDPVDGFRASVSTAPEIKAFVEAYYPDTEIFEIIHHPGINYEVDIFVGADTTDERIREMRTFLETVLGTDTVRVTRRAAGEDAAPADEPKKERVSGKIPPLIQFLDNSRLGYHRELSCSAAEADYWFSNAESIYQNRISRLGLPFFRDRQKNCFMDCSTSNGLDIRNALFLYETVYIGMPMEKHLDSFLMRQRMTKKELVELVDMGKVVLVLTGTEGRYDRGILNEAYGATPFGVIGRRGINILMAAYLSDLEKRYSDHFPGVYEISKELYRSARRESDKNLLLAAELMSFPRLAKAKSFVHLNNDGLLSLSAFGVNTIVGDMLTAVNEGAESGSLDLLLAASMGPVHLAMALNAAYLPNSCSGTGIPGIGMSPDVRLADIMENLLSLYWYREDQFSYIQRSRHIGELDRLELFECDRSLPVLDVARIADDWNTPALFGELLDGIAKLPIETQNEKIREYNHLLFEIAKLPDRSSVIDMIMTGVGYLPVPDGASTAMNVLDLLKNAVSGQKNVKEYQEKKNLKKKLDQITEKKTDPQTVEDIYLLDKVHRVARLRQRSLK